MTEPRERLQLGIHDPARRAAILMVDDHEANLVALRRVLTDLDAEIVAATSGEAALQATLEREFALAILDVRMPGMDGYELAGLLRNDARTRRLPIIFVTAEDPDDQRVFEGYEAGAVDYIVKPYNPVVLLAKVRVFLELHAKTTALAERVDALAASEERFRVLVMTVPEIVFRLDPEGRFTFLNEAVCNLGYAPEELLGRHFSGIMVPADVDRCSREVVLPRFAGRQTGPEGAPRLFDERRTGARRTTGLEVRLMPRRSREARFVEVSSSGLYGGATAQGRRVFLGTVGVIHDITDRKRADEELRKHRDDLEATVAQRTAEIASLAQFPSENPNPVLRVTNAAEVLYANAAAAPILRHWQCKVGERVRGACREHILEAVAVGRIREYELCAEGRVYSVQFVPRPDYENVYALDITERKRAEEALRQANARLRWFIDANVVGVVIAGAAGEIHEANDYYLDLIGYTRDEFDQGKVNWRAITPPEWIPADEKALAELRERGVCTPYEKEYVRRDGTRVAVLLSDAMIPGPDAQIVAFALDITKRKRAEEALRRSQARMQRAEAIAHLGSWELDLRRNHLFWSDEVYRIFGLEPQAFEATYEAFLERVHPDDRRKVDEAYGSSIRENLESYEIEHRIVRAGSGEVRVVQERCVHERDATGAIVRSFGMVHDITERKLAEGERARLVAAIEQAAETIMITDVRGTILYCNPAFEKTTGYERLEALGKNPRILKSGKQDAAFYGRMWETLARGEVWSGHFVNKRKDGTLFEEEATISPVRDAGGAIVNYVAVKRDITHERALEAQLQQARKLESIGRLAGGVAHDFNNLLTVIISNVELALDVLREPDPVRHDLVAIQEASQRAAALTRQLLAFSRKQVLEPRVIDLNEVISGVGKLLGRLLGEDIDIAMHLTEGLGRVMADPGQLEQVIVNLCVNARDAMPQGGRLTVETANVELDAGYAASRVGVEAGSYVVLSITDTGSGMDAAVRDRIFEPFFTTKGPGKGTGLGLATVYGIVKQSGGNVWVYSEPGQGSTFKIYLPRMEAPPVVERRPAESSASPGAGETVLVVEDEQPVRNVAARILRRAGYKVLSAANGAEALQIFRSHEEIDLLLTDVVMPKMGGREVAGRLSDSRPGLKVLYTSGYTDDAIVHHGVLEPGAHFISKPFTAAALTRKVREVLDEDSPTRRG